MRLFFLLLAFSLYGLFTKAQAPFSVSVQAFELDGFQGAQSFVSATHEGYILVIGGRRDGLHRRQPFASFSPLGNNTLIQLLQPESEAYYQVDVSVLPTPLREQLQSTNMEFYQKADQLYIIGGYGYSETLNDHITFPNLTIVDLPLLVQAIIAEEDINAAFRQLSDDRMAVTGGYLQMLQDTFYLVGGQRFTGRYNPHDGPSFIQEYTNQVRRFTINEAVPNLTIDFYEAWTDEMHLHRRDYNLVPQIFPNGQLGLTAFSGVFQHEVDLPFLNTVDITPEGHTVNNAFEQYLNHYHCGTAPLYEVSTGAMHTLFFGGMSQFYLDETGTLQEDQEVPFVPTIGCVSRYADGSMTEQKVGGLPALLGSGSEFIPVLPDLASTPDIQALNLPAPGDSILIGYLVGGIESSAPNIFFINTGAESIASNSLFRVYLKTPIANNSREVEPRQALQSLKLFPNPAESELTVGFDLLRPGTVRITLVNSPGKIIQQWPVGRFQPGVQQITVDIEHLPAGQYWINVGAHQSQLALPFVKN